MPRRITKAMLEINVARINALLGTPQQPYVGNEPQGGNYHLDYSNDKVSLRQMSWTKGCSGSSSVLACGQTSPRNLFEHMHTFLEGIRLGNGPQDTSA
ncbi:hypothetical protein UFOVP1254_53 [uncultured Caudovirales phage]|uniref:Uncharacterized protein n=1 Tax=uncultured Caudovirales phage TaxID=2100421 RepID=A0A6J5RRG0_9CAUD|nr:hypothetical protein UFOVP1254_53 [uncultured Caudovirales phage]